MHNSRVFAIGAIAGGGLFVCYEIGLCEWKETPCEKSLKSLRNLGTSLSILQPVSHYRSIHRHAPEAHLISLWLNVDPGVHEDVDPFSV